MKESDLQIGSLRLGDLVRVEWFDASIGKSLSGGLNGIDVQVLSFGIYLGVFGKSNQHILLAQNCFRYADSLYDIDYTAIPIGWTGNVTVIQRQHIPKEEADALLRSFLIGGRHAFPRRARQQHLNNHAESPSNKGGLLDD
ncbi:hypothetical protein H5T51_08615 [Candidatus Bathyarchaeota archaeon]|nr:hypothetical protein [Candidatus Bathyarchaeota archaeon]